ncbi:MAG: PIN domain-containing protein [Rhodanobacter sp.]
MRVFIDTNLWVYRLDQREIEKSRFATTWLRETARDHEIVISSQVMIELRAVLSHKFKPAWSASDVSGALRALSAFEVVTTDANLVLDADVLAGAAQLSWLDALIAEAAIRSGCAILFSEDFGHERRFGGTTVRNPFNDLVR